jgi:two-component system sensor histidine kinase DegS
MLSIKDNGAGFDPSLRTQSTGLVGMKERAESIAGKLLIKSEIGKGTQITFAASKKWI